MSNISKTAVSLAVLVAVVDASTDRSALKRRDSFKDLEGYRAKQVSESSRTYRKIGEEFRPIIDMEDIKKAGDSTRELDKVREENALRDLKQLQDETLDFLLQFPDRAGKLLDAARLIKKGNESAVLVPKDINEMSDEEFYAEFKKANISGDIARLTQLRDGRKNYEQLNRFDREAHRIEVLPNLVSRNLDMVILDAKYKKLVSMHEEAFPVPKAMSVAKYKSLRAGEKVFPGFTFENGLDEYDFDRQMIDRSNDIKIDGDRAVDDNGNIYYRYQVMYHIKEGLSEGRSRIISHFNLHPDA